MLKIDFSVFLLDIQMKPLESTCWSLGQGIPWDVSDFASTS